MMTPLEPASTKLCYLDAQGRSTKQWPAFATPDWLQRAYRILCLTRLFDRKAVALQRTGQLGTYPACLGQEAVGTGIGMAMHADDLFVPYYRDQATLYLRGVHWYQILQLWGGDERGNLFEGNARHDLPPCIPIATQITHAAGVATAIKYRHEHRAVVTTCGDGATSRGDFYEAMNLAGAWQLPLVIVINNNQWAISVPRALQTAASTLAQKSVAAGINGVQVDGNDVIAVHDAVDHALQRARQGKGATLIEAVSYRLCDHTTADDASRYRSAEELKAAWEYDPIKRLQSWLHTQGLWSPEQEQTMMTELQAEVEQAVDHYLGLPQQQPDEFLLSLFQEPTWALQQQRSQLLEKLRTQGDQHHGH